MDQNIEDIFDLAKRLCVKFAFTVKISCKFVRVFPYADVEVVTIAEFLQQNKLGYYRTTTRLSHPGSH